MEKTEQLELKIKALMLEVQELKELQEKTLKVHQERIDRRIDHLTDIIDSFINAMWKGFADLGKKQLSNKYKYYLMSFEEYQRWLKEVKKPAIIEAKEQINNINDRLDQFSKHLDKIFSILY